MILTKDINIIDSDISLKQALAHDPDRPEPPKEILEQLALIDVEHFSFDGVTDYMHLQKAA